MIQESAFGFRNIKPRTRSERKGMKDKVALEKQRLNQRVGFQARMHQANAPETTAGLTSCPTDAAGYISNAERFHTDTAGEEYQRRQEELLKKKRAEDFRRNQMHRREEDRWETMEQKQAKEEEKWHKLRESGVAAVKNSSNVAYDVVTLQYNQDVHGEQQKYYDDLVRYRAKVRAKQMVELGDTRVPYNIINGSSREEIPMPAPVTIPPSIASGYQSGRASNSRTMAH